MLSSFIRIGIKNKAKEMNALELLKIIVGYIIISFIGFYVVLQRDLSTSIIDSLVGLIIFLVVFKFIKKDY